MSDETMSCEGSRQSSPPGQQRSAPPPQLTAELERFAEQLTKRPGLHYVDVEPFATGPSYVPLREPISRERQLVGVAAVTELLDEQIGKSLANPIVAPPQKKCLVITAPQSSGVRTATRLFCLRNSCNLIVHRLNNVKEVSDPSFAFQLVELAMAMKPCVLLLHHPQSRMALVAPHFLHKIWDAFYVTHREASATPLVDIWLVIVDKAHPGVCFAPWYEFRTGATLTAAAEAQCIEYMQARFRLRMETMRIAPTDIDAMMSEQYDRLIKSVVTKNNKLFVVWYTICEFVNALFSKPVQRKSIDEIQITREGCLDESFLPTETDFEVTVSSFGEYFKDRQKQQQLIEEDYRKAEAAARRQANHPDTVPTTASHQHY